MKISEKWDRVISEAGDSYGQVRLTSQNVLIEQKSSYLEKLLQFTPSRSLVLEAGCGSGLRLLALSSLGHQAVGIDFNLSVLDNIRRNAGEISILPPFCVRADCEALPFKSVFDVAYNEGVVEHWLERKDRVQVIKQMASVVKAGGHVAIFVPNGKHPLIGIWELLKYPGYFGAHSVPFHRYDIQELKEEMKEAGLSVVHSGGMTPFATLNLWPRLPFVFILISFLEKTVPLPKSLREKFGHSLCCVGQKKI